MVAGFGACKDSVTRSVVVVSSPVADFAIAGPTFSCKAPLTVNFSNTTANASSFTWDFGDGTSSTLANPSHIYIKEGLYPVTLVVKNKAGCANTAAKNDLVKILPDWNNAEQSGIFAENFFPDYPIDTLKKYARDLYAKAGKIISVKEVKPENQLRGSFIIEGEKTDIEIYFTLSPENPPLIQEYHIREVPKEKLLY